MQTPKIQNQELFCHKYWKRMLANNNEQVNNLSQSFCIHEINQYLIGGYKPMKTENIMSAIAATDRDFKCYKKTEEKLTLWRGIDGAEMFKNPFMEALLKKCKKLKKGDILRMREYAFATDERIFAEGYTQNKGILYEITVPKGSRIADDWHYIFPRESKFLCTKNKPVNKNGRKFRHIKLTYLTDEQYNEAKKPNKSIWEKLKMFLVQKIAPYNFL